MSIYKIDPCPFCGGQAECRNFMGTSWVVCKIETCGSSGPSRASEHNAIALWNRRPDTSRAYLSKIGKIKTKKKAASSRENGKLGGRPKKKKDES